MIIIITFKKTQQQGRIKKIMRCDEEVGKISQARLNLHIHPPHTTSIAPRRGLLFHLSLFNSSLLSLSTIYVISLSYSIHSIYRRPQ